VEFNLAQVHEAVEQAVPERECIVFRDLRLSYSQVGDRTRRLANALLDRGLGKVLDRSTLARHETGQDQLAVYLHNGHEYLESMLGAYKARVAPFNVNYRYVAEELQYLLDDSQARAIVYHSEFAPTLDAIRSELPELAVLIQVRDASRNDLIAGAEWYEDVIAEASAELPDGLAESWSPDDLYILYTGGTTGMPKGVLWRQADIFVGALGGRRLDTGEEWDSLDQITEQARSGGMKLLPSAPFMHGAAHWMAFNAFANANSVYISGATDHLDPDDVLHLIQTEGIHFLLIVGDAFGRPIVQAIEASNYQLDSLLITVSGGASLSPGIKDRLLAAVPTMMILDGLGASETGQQASQLSVAGQPSRTGTFAPGSGMCVLAEDFSELLPAGHEGIGWVAQAGRVPLGYLGDEKKSALTFPTLQGLRYSVPGDRGRLLADGQVELFGRDSATINSGGEKIFAEEVEQALLRHRSVEDCVVASRPSTLWGQEVVAIVQISQGIDASDADILEEAARHIARYKLPKAIVRVDQVQRSPSGKADYRWAAEVASAVQS